MKAVHLEIGRIVAEGLPEAQQRQFARSLEEHLRAWAASGAASGIAGNTRVRIPALDAGVLKPGASASEAARQVANSIARRVGASGQSGKPGNAAKSGSAANASGQEARGHV
jgi:hypothetical protein